MAKKKFMGRTDLKYSITSRGKSPLVNNIILNQNWTSTLKSAQRIKQKELKKRNVKKVIIRKFKR